MSPERVYSKEDGKELLAQHIARYKFAQAFVTNKTVVDFACGSGYGTAMLAEAKPKNVTGIDISQDAVSYAKTHFEIPGVTFLQGSSEVLSGMRAVDIIVSFETIEHLAMYDSFMEIVANVLSPNGILIISTPVRQSDTLFDKPDNPFHLREWNEEEFSLLLSNYFGSRDFYYQYIYKKMWYPLSRTIASSLVKKFYPDSAVQLKEFSVLSSPPNVGILPLLSAYMIVVCKKPVVKKTT